MTPQGELSHDRIHSEEAHAAFVDKEIRRQKLWILVIASILVAAVLASILGFDFGRMLQGTPGGEGKPDGGAAPAGTAATPGDGSKPAGSDTKAPASTLKPQSEARRTHSLIVVAWPTSEMLADMQEVRDRAWLPACVDAIGTDLCDRNRALESGWTTAAARTLPRMRNKFDPGFVDDVRFAAEVEHLIAVEFDSKLTQWRLHLSTHGKRTTSSDWTAWPDAGAVTLLINQIRQTTEQATGYALSTDHVFTEKEEAARAFAGLEQAIARFRASNPGRDPGSVMVKPDAELDAALQQVTDADPDFDYAHYRRAMTAWEAGQHSLAISIVRGRIAKGNPSSRLPGLLGLMLVQEGNPKSREQGVELLKQETDKERLNMAAYSYWSNAWFSRPADGDEEVGSLAQARAGIQRYPEDGRYHILMAKELCTNPLEADKSFAYAEQGEKLRPWSHSVGFHRGFAHFSMANYSKAAEEFVSAWVHDPNRLENWIEMMARSLTSNARRLPGRKVADDAECDETTGFIFSLAQIARHLVSSEYGAILDRLFDARRAKCEQWVLDTAAKVRPDDNNYVITLMADIAVKLVRNRRGELGTKEQGQETVLLAIKRYRDFGGRAPEIERIWQAAKAAGSLPGTPVPDQPAKDGGDARNGGDKEAGNPKPEGTAKPGSAESGK